LVKEIIDDQFDCPYHNSKRFIRLTLIIYRFSICKGKESFE